MKTLPDINVKFRVSARKQSQEHHAFDLETALNYELENNEALKAEVRRRFEQVVKDTVRSHLAGLWDQANNEDFDTGIMP